LLIEAISDAFVNQVVDVPVAQIGVTAPVHPQNR
jgi:hypothetical protein